jgi:hypothetical protein
MTPSGSTHRACHQHWLLAAFVQSLRSVLQRFAFETRPRDRLSIWRNHQSLISLHSGAVEQSTATIFDIHPCSRLLEAWKSENNRQDLVPHRVADRVRQAPGNPLLRLRTARQSWRRWRDASRVDRSRRSARRPRSVQRHVRAAESAAEADRRWSRVAHHQTVAGQQRDASLVLELGRSPVRGLVGLRRTAIHPRAQQLFTNSASPRIDAEECALLNAANCRAMSCHSGWYRDLIAKQRGPANQSPIIM